MYKERENSREGREQAAANSPLVATKSKHQNIDGSPRKVQEIFKDSGRFYDRTGLLSLTPLCSSVAEKERVIELQTSEMQVGASEGHLLCKQKLWLGSQHP